MIARRITRPAGYPEKLRAPGGGPAHQVEVDGEDFVATCCEERWPRAADGEVLPDHYRGARCAGWKEA